MASGTTIRCMAKGFSLGLTGAATKVPMRTIRSMASEFLLSEMAVFTKDNGRTESSTAEESTGRRRCPVKAFGRTALGSSGWTTRRTRKKLKEKKIILNDFRLLSNRRIV